MLPSKANKLYSIRLITN